MFARGTENTPGRCRGPSLCGSDWMEHLSVPIAWMAVADLADLEDFPFFLHHSTAPFQTPPCVEENTPS